MKNIIELINEASSNKKTKYTIKDLQEALNYYEDYYNEYPEEKGVYPNWGELDNYFSNQTWCEALMNEEKDPLVEIVDKIFDILYDK